MDDLRDDEALAPRDLVPAPSPAPAAPAAAPDLVPVAAPELAPAPPPPPPPPLSPLAAEPPVSPPPAPVPPARREALPRQDRRGPRPELLEAKEPVFRQAGVYRLRLDPPDLARLRELPGSRDKTDRELGEQFLEAQEARLIESIAGDVPADAEIRVVVDPYSRQAFLAVGRTIQGIVSF